MQAKRHGRFLLSEAALLCGGIGVEAMFPTATAAIWLSVAGLMALVAWVWP